MSNFDFGDANPSQKEAIEAVDGPVLITAGPGTGKTHTLVLRAIYLIAECGVLPENIFIATFTEKAAKELITRLTAEFIKREINANINEMYIGTFHSLCLRILKDNLEYTRFGKNIRVLDQFDQQYTIYSRYNALIKDIAGIDSLLDEYDKNGNKKEQSNWDKSKKICTYVNCLTEELADPQKLISDSDPSISSLGCLLDRYQKLLVDETLLDFSSIQVETYNLLKNNQSVLEDLQNKITHIMVDEYQDTNYIQEQLVFLLAGASKNICVVGDDDQGLYRFRGATIRNILDFPKQFNGDCRIPLTVNYRSNKDIIDLYNKWMMSYRWGKYRFEKEIVPHIRKEIKSPAAVKLADPDEIGWQEKIYQLIRDLIENSNIKDYNQIAFLFKSIKGPKATGLSSYLENKGVGVYSPRSDQFFEREEIMRALGCLMLMFPKYVKGLNNSAYTFMGKSGKRYFINCVETANQYLKKEEHSDLRDWIRSKGENHLNLQGTTDYAYCELLYEMFQFSPFKDYLDVDLKGAGVADVRRARNMALLIQYISKYESLNNIDVLNSKEYRGKPRIDMDTEKLFNSFIYLLFKEGISEYEDEVDYAPKGCVSFMTIHQAKGMEFPVVFVGLPGQEPPDNPIDLLREKLEEKGYLQREAFEPYKKIKYFDFRRLYYTAFRVLRICSS